MASSSENRHEVGDILVAVGNALGPFVVAVYKAAYADEKYLSELQQRLRGEVINSELVLYDEDVALEQIDLSGWLTSIIRNQNIFQLEQTAHIFADRPQYRDFKNDLYELRRIRNKWAHPIPSKEFTDNEVRHLSDIASRVSRAVQAQNGAEDVPILDGEDAESGYLSSDSLRVQEDKDQAINVDLSRTSLHGLDLRGRNLRRATFTDADLSASNLQGENLSRALLAGANLSDVDMQRCNFDYADLHGANMSRANLADSRFYGANLVGAKLVNAHAPSSYFSGDLSRADFTGAILTYVRIDEDSNLSYVTLRGVDMMSCRMAWVELPYADLTNANLQFAKIVKSNLTNATLSEANLMRASIELSVLKYADLSSADLSYANIRHPELEGTNWREWEDRGAGYYSGEFENANLANATMEGADMPVAIFRKAIMTNANLTAANLQCADLQRADLTGAIFYDADLSAAYLGNTILLDTDFLGANLECADFTSAKFRYSTRLPDGSFWDEDTDMTKFTGRLEDC